MTDDILWSFIPHHFQLFTLIHLHLTLKANICNYIIHAMAAVLKIVILPNCRMKVLRRSRRMLDWATFY